MKGDASPFVKNSGTVPAWKRLSFEGIRVLRQDLAAVYR